MRNVIRRLLPARLQNPRGQAMTEFITLTFFMLGMGTTLVMFAPDALGAITIYVNGFYLVLGLPLG